jgi:hypothetical protein
VGASGARERRNRSSVPRQSRGVNPPGPRVPKDLRWIQPQAEPDHELRDADDRLVGALHFLPKPAATWGSTDRRRARAAFGESRWDLSIERKGLSGLFGLAGTALVDEGRTGLVKAGPFFSTGTLSMSNGPRFRWQGSALEGVPSTFADESGRPLVIFRNGSFFTRVNALVDVQPEAAEMPEWPLLAVLGLYLRLLTTRPFR